MTTNVTSSSVPINSNRNPTQTKTQTPTHTYRTTLQQSVHLPSHRYGHTYTIEGTIRRAHAHTHRKLKIRSDECKHMHTHAHAHTRALCRSLLHSRHGVASAAPLCCPVCSRRCAAVPVCVVCAIIDALLFPLPRLQHLYGLTLQRTTMINVAVFGNFSGAKAQEFVVAKGRYLELLRLVEPGILQSISTSDVYGVIRSLKPFRLHGTCCCTTSQ